MEAIKKHELRPYCLLKKLESKLIIEPKYGFELVVSKFLNVINVIELDFEANI